jgi:hypothetical protein
MIKLVIETYVPIPGKSSLNSWLVDVWVKKLDGENSEVLVEESKSYVSDLDPVIVFRDPKTGETVVRATFTEIYRKLAGIE